MQTLIIHGRQPGLGRAELESLYGAEKMRTVGQSATLIDLEPKEIDFSRLGGMVKFCKVLALLDTTNWNDIEKFLLSTTPEHFENLPEGKLKIGLSVYELKTSPRRLQATALKIKSMGKQTGRSIRVIPNKTQALNSATVLYNKLTQKLGWELVFVRTGEQTIVAQSIAVQDIDKYAARDQNRPYRDARIGMLPPKLAQTIINLAVGKQAQQGQGFDAAQGSSEKRTNRTNGTESERQSVSNAAMREEQKWIASSAREQNSAPLVLLDPFCGTGVILQEAVLMGYGVLGSDIDLRMVEYSEWNLQWLRSWKKIMQPHCEHIKQADATKEKWDHNFDAVACETYLGPPLSSLPDQEALQKIIDDCDHLHADFLKNIAHQTNPGLRLCVAVPAWKTKSGFKRLATLDKLGSLGYNRVSFTHARADELIYHRPSQIVARELVVLERK